MNNRQILACRRVQIALLVILDSGGYPFNQSQLVGEPQEEIKCSSDPFSLYPDSF